MELDSRAWELIFNYNALPENPDNLPESTLDNQYCMRCGGTWNDCDCAIVVSERTFAEFMDNYGRHEEDLYEETEDFASRSCGECIHQGQSSCRSLLDYIHDLLSDYAIKIDDFKKITLCDDFQNIYFVAPNERVN